MIKYGCMALVAMACAAAMPAAHAEGNFFVAGHVGQASYDDTGFEDDSASTRALSGGYRWQAGPIIQVGIEAGLGSIGEVGEDYDVSYSDGYRYTGSVGVEADYRHLGANARITFGEGSRWFAIARGGYMAYEMDARIDLEERYNGTLIDSFHDTASDDGGGAYFGGGVGVDITQNFNVNLMFNGFAYSDFEENSDGEFDVGTASTTTLGVEVRF